MKKFFTTMKSGVMDFIEDECMTHGASLAYYTIFSLPPLLVLVFYIAGAFGVSEARVSKVVSKQLGLPLARESQPARPTQSAEAAESSQDSGQASSGESAEPERSGGLESVANRQASASSPMQGFGTASKVFGILLLVFSATGLFAQLQYSLNQAWEIAPDPERAGWKNFVFKRVTSLGMILVIAFLLLVSLVATTLVDEAVGVVVGGTSGTVSMAVGIVVNNVLALVMATLLFAAMYKILPDADMRWKDMWAGALITAILFVAGKAGMGWYL